MADGFLADFFSFLDDSALAGFLTRVNDEQGVINYKVLYRIITHNLHQQITRSRNISQFKKSCLT